MSDYHVNEMCINELDRPISKEEVRQLIRNLKQGEAPGLDNVCGEYLKDAEVNITLLFNKIYDSSCFPSVWCKSIIIPLFKRGNETDPDNYRGISLLSVVSKVFTAILNKRLHSWAEKEGNTSKGLGTRCNFLTSATSGLPQVAIQIAVLAAHVATLNRSPRNPIPNKNSRGTIRDFSFAQAMGHRVIRNAAL